VRGSRVRFQVCWLHVTLSFTRRGRVVVGVTSSSFGNLAHASHGLQYLSVTVLPDVTAHEHTEFNLDDDVRPGGFGALTVGDPVRQLCACMSIISDKMEDCVADKDKQLCDLHRKLTDKEIADLRQILLDFRNVSKRFVGSAIFRDCPPSYQDSVDSNIMAASVAGFGNFLHSGTAT